MIDVETAFPQPMTDQHLLQAELVVRNSVPTAAVERVEEVADRLERLSAGDDLSAVDVDQWPLEHGHALDARSRRDLLDDLRSWADRHDYSLEPAFRSRTVTQSMIDEQPTVERLSVPLVTLLVYEEGDLVWVAPCTDGDDVHTVEDCLRRFESNEGLPIDTDRSASGDRADSSRVGATDP